MHIKATRLQIRNIGICQDIDIPLDKPLILLIGGPMEGKTTILNSIDLLAGGGFPPDLLRHGEKDGDVILTLTNGSITRTFYRGADGTTKARAITYVVDGQPARGNVVRKLADLFNPFLRDQRYFIDMKTKDRHAYLLGLLDVDTSAVDAEIAGLEERAALLRVEIKAAGAITPVKVELVDELALMGERGQILKEHEQAVKVIEDTNKLAGANNDRRLAVLRTVQADKADIAKMLKLLANARERMANNETWMADPVNAEQPIQGALPNAPDTSALDEQISDARAVAVRHEMYQKDLADLEAKAVKEAELKEAERTTKVKRALKLAQLAESSDACPVSGLGFSEAGALLYEGATIPMISGSQEQLLTAKLRALYPDDLGLQLMDGAEKLGLFLEGNTNAKDLIRHAEDEDLTIMASVVSEERDAPNAKVGVWFVKKGQVVNGSVKEFGDE